MNNNQIEEFFIWDEKSCTEHQTKSENKTENGMNVTIPETKKESNKKSLKDTIKNEWKRNCPTCDKELAYKYKCSFVLNTKRNSLCSSCAHKGRTPVNKVYHINHRNCPKCSDVIYYPNGKIMMSAERNNRYCQKCAGNKKQYSSNPQDWKKNCPICGGDQQYTDLKSYKDAVRKNSKCLKCATKIASNTESVRYERRMRRLNQHTPNFNFNACTYFDKLNEQNQWQLQHALNGGEVRVIGYSLDAYDKNLNIVVEYDEPAHYTKSGKLKRKDVIRQQRIITHLGCKFYRFNERTQQLYEVT